jgi:hypothetical protein
VVVQYSPNVHVQKSLSCQVRDISIRSFLAGLPLAHEEGAMPLYDSVRSTSSNKHRAAECPSRRARNLVRYHEIPGAAFSERLVGCSWPNLFTTDVNLSQASYRFWSTPNQSYASTGPSVERIAIEAAKIRVWERLLLILTCVVKLTGDPRHWALEI